MVDRHIHELVKHQTEEALERLEADIWVGTAARKDERRAAKMVACWQAGVLALALVASAAAGMTAVRAEARTMFAPETQLAPSVLLLGVQP